MQKKKRKNRKWILLLILFLILCGLGIGIYFWYTNRSVTFDFSFLDHSLDDVQEQVKAQEQKELEEQQKELEEQQKELEEQQKEELKKQAEQDNGYGIEIEGPTYIDGILIVNKTYSLPDGFATGNDPVAYQALLELQSAASSAGYSIPLISGFRSQATQTGLYNRYVARDGKDVADTYSARPGHSEHETGLAYDIGEIDNNYGETPAGTWLAQHAHEFGFIIRYPKGKEYITKYQYEPWHVRYVGLEHAAKIYEQDLTLEEYLGIA